MASAIAAVTQLSKPDAGAPELGYKQPLFLMGPGAATTFAGSTLCHGTTAHHAESERDPSSKAHVSFAVQTPAAPASRTPQLSARLHEEMLEAGYLDAALSPQWKEHAVAAGLALRPRSRTIGLLTYSEFACVCYRGSASCSTMSRRIGRWFSTILREGCKSASKGRALQIRLSAWTGASASTGKAMLVRVPQAACSSTPRQAAHGNVGSPFASSQSP